MAPTNATTAAPTSFNGTIATSTVASTWSGWYNNSDVSTSTTTSYVDYYPSPDYVYFYSGYAFYVVLFFLFVILLPFAVIMSSMQRKRQEAARRLALQRQRARQQMEISVTNNSTANTSSNCGNGSVCIQADNDMTILPKGMDLPPSYDELNIGNNVKQEGNIGASTLTITTDLECSNPNLATALNEPPPDYDQGILNSAPPQTTTISTTTVVSVTPRI